MPPFVTFHSWPDQLIVWACRHGTMESRRPQRIVRWITVLGMRAPFSRILNGVQSFRRSREASASAIPPIVSNYTRERLSSSVCLRVCIVSTAITGDRMTPRKSGFGFAGVLLSILALTRVSAAQSPKADLLLIHGHILTVDAKDSVAQAIAVRHGIIVKVGSDAEVLDFAGNDPGIRVLDLHGTTATPGLIDTHAHIADGGADELYGITLSDASSVAEIVARVKAKIALVKPGEWVKGAGWDEGKLAEHRYVTAADLDAVSPNNPVWLTHTTGHYGVANSAALKLAHITAGTPDPTAGTIDRDSHGNPTGVLKEDSAMEPVTHLIPAITLEQMRQGILHMQQVLHSEGVTAVKDPNDTQM